MARVVSQSRGVVMKNQKQIRMTFDTQVKTAITESYLHLQARNRTLKLLTIVDDVGNIVMDNMCQRATIGFILLLIG